MKDTNSVLIFAKWPTLGRSKTRIAKVLGDDFALKFSEACLDDLMNNLLNSRNYNVFFGADNSLESGLFSRKYGVESLTLPQNNSQKINQSEKFQYYFSELINGRGYKNVILIPMDVPFLKTENFEEAFSDLKTYRHVIGPEMNGGVYLIGLRNPLSKNTFDGVRWGSETSFNDLYRNLNEPVKELKFREDMNTVEDIIESEEILRESCPRVSFLLSTDTNYRNLVENNKILVGDPVENIKLVAV